MPPVSKEHPEYPNAGPFKDRHGKTRWRFRRSSKTTPLPRAPGHPEFEAAYLAAVEGRPVARTTVRRLPTAALPRTLRAAWRAVVKSPEWHAMEKETRDRQEVIAEDFLSSRIDTKTWGDLQLSELKRRHIREILADYVTKPHAGRHLLTVIRKMILAGLDAEWIDSDPSYKLKYRPAYKGWRAWTTTERAAFEKRWPVGTTPRIVYALALWLGDRRGDIAALETSALRGDLIEFSQGKTGRPMRLSITPMLREVLDATDLTGSRVVRTTYGEPFSEKSLTGRFRDWCRAAGLSDDCKLHGLRKTLGKMLAESGATTRQIMDTLGHTDIKHAELYSKDAEQEMLARDGLASVTRLHQRRG